MQLWLTSILHIIVFYFKSYISFFQDSNVWATILALAWLQVNFSANKDEWDMIEMKAYAWLASKDLKGKTKEHLIEKAKQLNLKI